MKLILSLLLVLLTINASAKVEVKGRVLGGDGKPCIMAHIHSGKTSDGMKNRSTVECKSNGEFSIELPGGGNYTLWASGVNHEEISIPLYLLDDVTTVVVAIRLKPNLRNQVVTEPAIIGDWNKFSFSSSSPMSRSADGKSFTYELTATSDSIAYQILNVTGGHSMNGSMSDRYDYDGGGDYRSIIKTKAGSTVTITYEPDKIRYINGGEASVTFINNAFLQKTYELKIAQEEATSEIVTVLSGMSKEDPQTVFSKAYSKIRDEVNSAIKSGSTHLAEYASVLLADLYFDQYPYDQATAEMIYRIVSPESPMWGLAPRAVTQPTKLLDSVRRQNYLDRVVESNPEKSVRANVLADRLVKFVKSGELDKARSVYSVLKSDYGDIAELRYYMTEYNPDALIQIGKPLPDFDVKELGSDARITKSSMLGRYYLVDFWGTWCGPCIRELPEMSQVFEKFKGRKGFTIVSLALDPSEEVVTKFRSKRFAMPWIHTVLTGLWEDPVAAAFEVASVPKPILVGPDGKIVAKGESLRGKELEKTLAKYLGEL